MLALEIDPASLLPADNAAYGFDNNADALSLSPALTERYLGAAAKISQMALGQVRGSPSPETVFVPTDRNQGSRFSEDLPWGSRGGLAIRYYFPVDGEYLFQLRLNEGGAGGGIMGLTAEPHQLDVSLDRAKVWTSIVGGPDIRESARAGADGKNPGGPSVPRAGEGRLPSGSGVLPPEDLGVPRRPVRPVLASRSLSGRQRRAWYFQRDDYRPAFERVR